MSALTGTPTLLRASLRHNIHRVGLWTLLAALLLASGTIAYDSLFPDVADRRALAVTVGSNPALALILGPAYNLSTGDGFNAWRFVGLGGFLIGLGMIFVVTGATRAQEDSGQAELFASGVMGRGTGLAVAVCLGAIGSVLAGGIGGVAGALGGGSWNAEMLLGAGFTGTALMATGIAAVTAQLGSEARTSNSMAVATMAVLYLGRGLLYTLDVPGWLVWIDPLAWVTETRPAFENHWWPLLACLGLTLVLLAVAFWLQARRDFGAGSVAPRPGPARGRMGGVWALALRVHRGPIITWLIAFVVLGLVFGYFATSVPDILGDDAALKQIFASGAQTPTGLVKGFLVTLFSMIGIVATIGGVQTMLKVRSEEGEDRVEPVIATATTRWRYFGSNVLVAVALPAVGMSIAGVLAAAVASTADLGVGFGDVVLQAVATIPAAWTVVGLSVAIVGVWPRAGMVSWLGVLVSFLITLFGETLQLSDWQLGISPFKHVPTVSAADPDWTGLGWLGLVTLGFLVVGFLGFRRRDLAR